MIACWFVQPILDLFPWQQSQPDGVKTKYKNTVSISDHRWCLCALIQSQCSGGFSQPSAQCHLVQNNFNTFAGVKKKSDRWCMVVCSTKKYIMLNTFHTQIQAWTVSSLNQTQKAANMCRWLKQIFEVSSWSVFTLVKPEHVMLFGTSKLPFFPFLNSW